MDNLLPLIKKQDISCLLKNWSNYGIKGQVLPFAQKPKGIKKRDRQKSLHRASYVWMYFNELIHYVMEEEELTWNDDEWFPNEEL
jgi:hypothetical protein